MIKPKKGDILIVDDQPVSRKALTTMLTQQGFRVRSAVSGRLALESARKFPPDLILLDILMPDMDGYEICARLKADEATRDIPIIFISALGETQDRIKAFAAGGVDYVTRPFQIKEVQARVETHVALRMMQQQLAQKNAQLEAQIAERVRVEQALRREIDVAQRDLDVAGVIIVAIDAHQKVSLINRTGCRVLGYKEDDIIGQNWFETFVPVGLRDKVRDSFARLMAGRIEDVEYLVNPVLTEGGQERLIAWHNTVSRDQAGHIIGTISSGSDVTERNRAEEELRKLSRAVEQSPSMVIVTDTQGNIEYVNPKFTEITGYEAKEVIGQNTRLLQSGRQPLRFYAEMWDKIVADEEWRGEFDNQKKNGELYWERASISPVRNAEGVTTHFVKVAEDITEQKRAEEALQESEERYRSLFNTVPIGLYRSTPDGQLLDVNLALTQILGHPNRESILAINAADTYVNPREREQWKAQIDCKDIMRDFEARFRRSDGTIIWARTNARAIRDSDGRVMCYEGAMEDITERKRAEEQLQRYAIELEQRNGELDAFAHTVAHDLQNPLGIVVGFASALKEDYATMSRKKLGEHLNTIARNGRKMGNIIDALLLLAGVRKMEVQMSRIDMASVVAEARQRLTLLIEEYQAEIILPDNWPVAKGYAPWLEEVWVNYISNAIKYGGRPPRVDLGGEQRADGTVRLWTRDNGPGLAPEEHERLFTPFSRLHHQAGVAGHGLGLSIVRRIVERLGGQVGVESQVGRGSVFIFTLPGEVNKDGSAQ